MKPQRMTAEYKFPMESVYMHFELILSFKIPETVEYEPWTTIKNCHIYVLEILKQTNKISTKMKNLNFQTNNSYSTPMR